MPITVVCECGKRLSVKDEHAGKRGKCPACQCAIKIPLARLDESSNSKAIEAVAKIQIEPERTQSAPGADLSRSFRTNRVILISVAINCLFLILCVVYLVLSHGHIAQKGNGLRDHPPSVEPAGPKGKDRQPPTTSYDYSRLNPRTKLVGPKTDLFAIAFSPDGRYLAAAGGKYGEALAFTNPDGSGGWFGKRNDLGEIVIWSTESFETHSTLRMPGFVPLSLAFTPDSRTIAASGQDDDSYPTLRLWDVETSRERYRLPVEATSMAFDPTGKHIVTGNGPRDANDGHLMYPFRPTLRWLTLTHDGRGVVHRYGVIDLSTGDHIFDFTRDAGTPSIKSGRAVACSADGKLMVSGSRLRRTSDGLPIDDPRSFTITEKEPRDVAFSPDSKVLVITYIDGLIAFWNITNLQLLNSFQPYNVGPQSIGFSPDGKSFSMGFRDGVVLVLQAEAM